MNSSLGAHMTRNGGCYIRYPDIKASDEFISNDGVHLTQLGNQIFLNIMQGALETIITRGTGCIAFPDNQ